jgi:hypothetical protein
MRQWRSLSANRLITPQSPNTRDLIPSASQSMHLVAFGTGVASIASEMVEFSHLDVGLIGKYSDQPVQYLQWFTLRDTDQFSLQITRAASA